MSRKRPRDAVLAASMLPPPGILAREETVAINIPASGDAEVEATETQNGTGKCVADVASAPQKRFSSIRIADDGMETSSSDKLWPPNQDSIRNGHVNFGKYRLSAFLQNVSIIVN